MAGIVISEFMDESAVARLRARAEVLYAPDLVDRPEALQAALADCRALIVRNRTQLRSALLQAAPRLEIVGRLGVGLDNIDQAACAARGIKVFPATGANDDAVAEYVLLSAMLLLRGAFANSQSVIAGKWPRQQSIGFELAGKTLGLIGFGGTARATAARFAALGVRVTAFDPVAADGPHWQGVTRLECKALLAQADIVSLHVPLTDETRGLIDARALADMKSGAILINAARGGVLDEGALAAALTSGHLRGAALDVFDKEPLGAADGAKFAGVPNLLLTPHIAGVTDESNVRVSRLIADIVLRELELETA
jgi:(S)-sulfolactate dehydrogenase